MHDNDNDPTEYNERLGRNIRAARLLTGKTLEEVAGELGITYQHLQKHESGIIRVSVDRLERIAQVVGTHPAQLLPDISRPSEAEIPPRTLQLVAGIESLPNDKMRTDFARLIRTINYTWSQRSRTG